MTRFLDVYLKDTHVGTLEETNGRMTFTYLEGLSLLFAVSHAMPVREAPYQHNECHAYFGGLLPEEDQRQILAEALHISEKNDFRMLEEIGRDCAGAVSLWPQGETPPQSQHIFEKGGYRSDYPLSHKALRELFPKLRKNPLSEKRLRFSLAGAQSKIAILYDFGTNEFFLPEATQISTHIVKPASMRFEDSVENEWFCTTLCKEIGAGIEVSESWIVNLGEGERVFVTQRYDRMIFSELGPDNDLVPLRLDRLHQEDFCQALSIASENKYQEDRGPGYADCFRVIDDACSSPATERLKMLRLVIFNFLIGNNDAHGKNFSMLNNWLEIGNKTRMGEKEISPAYDLICTEMYEELDNLMSMKIGSRYDPYLVMKDDIQALCKDISISYPAFQRTARTMAETVRAHAGNMRRTLPPLDVYDRILAVIAKRSAHLLEVTGD